MVLNHRHFVDFKKERVKASGLQFLVTQSSPTREDSEISFDTRNEKGGRLPSDVRNRTPM